MFTMILYTNSLPTVNNNIWQTWNASTVHPYYDYSKCNYQTGSYDRPAWFPNKNGEIFHEYIMFPKFDEQKCLDPITRA